MATKFMPYQDDLGIRHAVQVDDAIYNALDTAGSPPFNATTLYDNLAALQAGEAGDLELLPSTIQPRLMVISTVLGQFTVICPLPFVSADILALENDSIAAALTLARLQGETNTDPEGVAA